MSPGRYRIRVAAIRRLEISRIWLVESPLPFLRENTCFLYQHGKVFLLAANLSSSFAQPSDPFDLCVLSPLRLLASLTISIDFRKRTCVAIAQIITSLSTIFDVWWGRVAASAATVANTEIPTTIRTSFSTLHRFTATPTHNMKVYSSTSEFDYSWDEVSTANWRKYCPWNRKTPHVIAVDTLSRSVDPATGVVSCSPLQSRE